MLVLTRSMVDSLTLLRGLARGPTFCILAGPARQPCTKLLKGFHDSNSKQFTALSLTAII